MIIYILRKCKPVMTCWLAADQNWGLVILSLKCLSPKIEKIETFQIVMKRKNTFCKFAPSVVKNSGIMYLASDINSDNYYWICYLLNLFILCIIHLESPVFDCFVYIRQDATQSYLEVLLYSIGAFNELQECSYKYFHYLSKCIFYIIYTYYTILLYWFDKLETFYIFPT